MTNIIIKDDGAQAPLNRNMDSLLWQLPLSKAVGNLVRMEDGKFILTKKDVEDYQLAKTNEQDPPQAQRPLAALSDSHTPIYSGVRLTEDSIHPSDENLIKWKESCAFLDWELVREILYPEPIGEEVLGEVDLEFSISQSTIDDSAGSSFDVRDLITGIFDDSNPSALKDLNIEVTINGKTRKYVHPSFDDNATRNPFLVGQAVPKPVKLRVVVKGDKSELSEEALAVPFITNTLVKKETSTADESWVKINKWGKHTKDDLSKAYAAVKISTTGMLEFADDFCIELPLTKASVEIEGALIKGLPENMIKYHSNTGGDDFPKFIFKLDRIDSTDEVVYTPSVKHINNVTAIKSFVTSTLSEAKKGRHQILPRIRDADFNALTKVTSIEQVYTSSKADGEGDIFVMPRIDGMVSLRTAAWWYKSSAPTKIEVPYGYFDGFIMRGHTPDLTGLFSAEDKYNFEVKVDDLISAEVYAEAGEWLAITPYLFSFWGVDTNGRITGSGNKLLSKFSSASIISGMFNGCVATSDYNDLPPVTKP